jgi:endo-1,4-beta-xylanase
MPDPWLIYATDPMEDPLYKTQFGWSKDGISVSANAMGSKRFAVNTRWYVEGFGNVWLGADNGGEYFSLAEVRRGTQLNLNCEFARSRVIRNRTVRRRYEKEGMWFSAEVQHLVALSEELLEDAMKKLRQSGERGAASADVALRYALWAGEKIELEKARWDIERRKRTDEVFFGCETRQFIWAKSEDFQKRFVELFNYATITHYVWDSWYELFEPTEGVYNWGIKDDILRWLKQHNITPEGRPLFWFHPSVTPEWLKAKNIDELKRYVERHTHDLVSHYGDDVHHWEVMNEYHDWGNIHDHTPDQITEITRLALDKTKETNPNVVRLLNNCCPWAEYVARGRMARMDATRPVRSPRQFLRDLQDADVEYEVLGIQIYFPQRDLSDIVRLLERLAVFNKPIYITEIGASSNLQATSSTGAITEQTNEPYAWHRHWDEDLQADWLEQVYTIYYSKPYVKAINWYDMSDFRPFIANGGLVREDSSAKQSFHRLRGLLDTWGRLPKSAG